MRWEQADLAARLCRALDIAERTLAHFAASGYTDLEVQSNSFGPEKPIAETAMLLYAASAVRRHVPSVGKRIDDLARLLVPHARSERVLLEIALRPSLSFVFAVPHVLLTKLGHPDPAFEDCLRLCATSQARNGHERAPVASVERRWVTGLWTGRKSDSSWRLDLANSVLNWPLDLLGGLREDAYALTHLFMYCTDFGFQKSRLPRQRSVILGEVGSLLAKYLDAGDYDLAGEILMAWPLTGAPWSSAATFGFRVLADAEDRTGVLPCGNTKTDRLNQLHGEQKVQYAFGTAYHTAYVMGFLCAAALRPERAPPRKIGGRIVEKSCLERILSFVDQKNANWAPEFSTLEDEERLALAPFLLDIAIVQNCRKHNYNAVAKLLALACHHSMANSPLCGQAAELLERLAACSKTINPGRNEPLATTPASL
ncbi:MAG: hypothetical protein WA849_13305 [Candidatus Udaeobacter sp.]